MKGTKVDVITRIYSTDNWQVFLICNCERIGQTLSCFRNCNACSDTNHYSIQSFPRNKFCDIQRVLASCEFHYCEFHYCDFSKKSIYLPKDL